MPRLLPIITLGHPTLQQRSKEVANIDSAPIQKLIDDMIYTMYEKDGIGLAAPQINQPHRITVLVPDPEKPQRYKEKKDKALVLINPTILKHSLLKGPSEEGCLSVPGIFGIVKRWKTVEIGYYDRDGVQKKLKASNLLAKCIQHEIDHLDGILFVQKSEKLFRFTRNM